MVIKIKNIIVGTFNNIFGRKKSISSPRLKICHSCDNIIHIKNIGNICKICGCVLESKTTIENEKCPINKW